jgi:CubicO group peptidase (beta-lactamase class C family)
VVATNRGVLDEGTFGHFDLAGSGTTIDTVLRIASMTKTVTPVAAMQFVAQGKLALDDPIGHILAELAAARVLEESDTARPPLAKSRSPCAI